MGIRQNQKIKLNYFGKFVYGDKDVCKADILTWYSIKLIINTY